MNNKGKGTGLTLLLILVVALIVAYLAVTQMRSLRPRDNAQGGQQQASDLVQQAQDAVDALNGKTRLP